MQQQSKATASLELCTVWLLSFSVCVEGSGDEEGHGSLLMSIFEDLSVIAFLENIHRLEVRELLDKATVLKLP